jgi:hypothetical protein
MAGFDRSSFTDPDMQLQMSTSSPSSRLGYGQAGETREFIAVATNHAISLDKQAARLYYTTEQGAYAASETSLIGTVDRQWAGEGWALEQMIRYNKNADYEVVCKIVGDGGRIPLEGTRNTHNFVPKCYETSADGEPDLSGVTWHVRCIIPAGFTSNWRNYVVKGSLLRISLPLDRDGNVDYNRGYVTAFAVKPDAYGGGWTESDDDGTWLTCAEAAEQLQGLF